MLKIDTMRSFKVHVITLGLVLGCESIKARAEEKHMLSELAAVEFLFIAKASLD